MKRLDGHVTDEVHISLQQLQLIRLIIIFKLPYPLLTRQICHVIYLLEQLCIKTYPLCKVMKLVY